MTTPTKGSHKALRLVTGEPEPRAIAARKRSVLLHSIASRAALKSMLEEITRSVSSTIQRLDEAEAWATGEAEQPKFMRDYLWAEQVLHDAHTARRAAHPNVGYVPGCACGRCVECRARAVDADIMGVTLMEHITGELAYIHRGDGASDPIEMIESLSEHPNFIHPDAMARILDAAAAALKARAPRKRKRA